VRRLLLISNSTNHGQGYLDHVLNEIDDFLGPVRRLLFVPFALKDRAGYGAKVRDRLAAIGVEVITLTDDEAGRRGMREAEAVFTGGGNTFRLLKTLQAVKILPILRERALGGMPYLGSSAGTNVAGTNALSSQVALGDWLGLSRRRRRKDQIVPTTVCVYVSEVRIRLRKFAPEIIAFNCACEPLKTILYVAKKGRHTS
jgi:hypothetical protein